MASLFSPLLLSVIQGEVIDVGVHMYILQVIEKPFTSKEI